MANENDSKKQLDAALAERDALKLEVARLQGLVEGLKSGGGGNASVLMNVADAKEKARVEAHVTKLHAMREKAISFAKPGAEHVKYIVGPSGTVRDGLGVVKPGTVISVPVKELPAGEWKVWEPSASEDVVPAKSADTASAIQRANGPSAAEKALAQREALKSQRASDREV